MYPVAGPWRDANAVFIKFHGKRARPARYGARWRLLSVIEGWGSQKAMAEGDSI